MKKILSAILLFTMIFSLTMCRKPETLDESEMDERLSGGVQTSFDATSKAFTFPFTGLTSRDNEVHGLGDLGFDETFVTAPSTQNSGLGPAFNNVSCISCHHNDGKGEPSAGGLQSSLLLRISAPGTDAYGGPLSVPGYGTQLQDKAIFGKQPECRVDITYTNQTYTFPDGETYVLQTPVYTLSNLYTPITTSYMLSPRLAPPVFGLGLLEAIPEADILANADVNDSNGDSISGKPNYVWDPVKNKKVLGRFGHKANTSSLLVQVAAAYNNDIGISNRIFPKETVDGQPQIDGLIDDYELPDNVLDEVTFYVQTLQVPARRNVTDEIVQRGKQIFMNAKCESCHKQTFRTGVNVSFPALSNQVIHPYTDMLLHDMGPGLADNRPDFDANGYEWRTTPLWGLGLLQTVNYPAVYLHDGRARTITEAIMWHDGEAAYSRNYVYQLSKSDREALLKFLSTL
jgi:CxxC motif-containing protein (DUF1111 family)